MGKDRSLWQGGRRAWERLNGWHQDSPSAKPGHPDDGADALDALADIGLVRRLLEQAELVAVRTARKHGKSWAEIATKLGVTRQSAWERWRDLDEVDVQAERDQPTSRVLRTSAEHMTAELASERLTGDVIGGAARELRRRASARVPNVIGLTWKEAVQVLSKARLVGVGQNPDGPPLTTLAGREGLVVDQSPESGATVPAGSPVTLWFSGDGGGSAGVREPRRPKPDPKSARETPAETSEDAIG